MWRSRLKLGPNLVDRRRRKGGSSSVVEGTHGGEMVARSQHKAVFGTSGIGLFLVSTRLSPFRQRQIKDRMGMWQEKEKKYGY